MTTSVAEETGNATSIGDNRACPDGESRENKCGNNTPSAEGRGCLKKPLLNGSRYREELLHLWQIWAYGPTL